MSKKQPFPPSLNPLISCYRPPSDDQPQKSAMSAPMHQTRCEFCERSRWSTEIDGSRFVCTECSAKMVRVLISQAGITEQQLKCLRGEHEASAQYICTDRDEVTCNPSDSHGVVAESHDGECIRVPISLCKHCRCLYVEKE